MHIMKNIFKYLSQKEVQFMHVASNSEAFLNITLYHLTNRCVKL